MPYTSGIETGMHNITVQNVCALDHSNHFEMASDSVTAAIVLNTLDPVNTRPVPCELVLPLVGPIGSPTI